ncbi:MAG: bifunctional demethylmenaquinone methyltransferase/2-methoxy-6-polyprenyl-1,4-benzoquinol methylase UbiE [Bacteroidetes bacterium]|nr:bifunctional demethylmenaquinone methyltransferase/2-methoxy-6-polyprenyl-1,4-benzoquinol methylase UbiE [Rhodothermia bacterium]MCS7155879.1 bifunctional demethylmenaquinone methyltransferase/2-methoxy-6-polyprenyl-1,4-benzoquinol methylase UbiE [Bacteroidota bacterium]MCX7906020.1 bifunctional demethylmenaquinone methyltransferase/2-methoxy-6-polyprenyl-1,4-benzoquinol methylase UbiE [Bacteroidota bacterium]MDW8138148.1 bifunctional demethylmenaquinone methyltransferase/2-methoxy-6-polypren
MRTAVWEHGKKDYVRALFNAIAHRYDLLNSLLSLGLDRYWRWRAIRWLASERPRTILDAATGTAELAIAAARLRSVERIVGVDIAEAMLERGRHKVNRLGLKERILLQRADSEALPFPDGLFDAAMVAFGVRNFENLDQGLRELRRVVRPGGVVLILEFARSRLPGFRTLFGFYFHHLLPRLGSWVSGHPEAYRYLPESVARFPEDLEFVSRLQKAGFRRISWRRLTFGVCALYKAWV